MVDSDGRECSSRIPNATLLIVAVLGLGIMIAYNFYATEDSKLQTCDKAGDISINTGETCDSAKPSQLHSSKLGTERAGATSQDKSRNEDQCFCQLHGAIDDCSCHVDTVDKFNNYKIHPRLLSLLAKDYFRFFEVNLKKECPFWSDDSQCALEGCEVKECRDDEVPVGLKGQRSMRPDKSQKLLNRVQESCDRDNELGDINTTISEKSQEGFERWKVYDESLVDFCSVKEDEVDGDLQYVDLLLNPERYTGYRGPSAHRIWKSIYLENCFKQSSINDIMSPFQLESQDESCIEKRTFYRVVSGLHASINIHLSAKYLLNDGPTLPFLKGNNVMRWGHNVTEFRHHFDASLTQGQGASWLKNLYFIYLLELKAVWKLAPVLRAFNFYTGNPVEDSDVTNAIIDLLGVIDQFPSHFEETGLFSRKDATKLKSEFHQRFTNITRIMDCVGCQKCKLWGTLQIKGLGTALKVLFSEPFSQKRIGNITRNEVVALLNSFGRLSESIYELDNFRRLISEESIKHGDRNSEKRFKIK